MHPRIWLAFYSWFELGMQPRIWLEPCQFIVRHVSAHSRIVGLTSSITTNCVIKRGDFHNRWAAMPLHLIVLLVHSVEPLKKTWPGGVLICSLARSWFLSLATLCRIEILECDILEGMRHLPVSIQGQFTSGIEYIGNMRRFCKPPDCFDWEAAKLRAWGPVPLVRLWHEKTS
jgi:hypothetical protein